MRVAVIGAGGNVNTVVAWFAVELCTCLNSCCCVCERDDAYTAASGIASTKVCLDHGFDPICFESSDAVGGLWRFTEVEAHSSVYR